jgi:hypothetical protein
MENTLTMSWKDYRGNARSQDVNQVIDVRAFVGTPGYALLVVAANTSLSVSDLVRYLRIGGVGRSRSWVQRRRWLFQQPDVNNAKGPRPDADGKEARAVAIMREYPKASLRDLTGLLKENGIMRSREWVRKHRCDELG